MGQMREFRFDLVGTSPLLMHADDIDMADELSRWRKDPANKNKTVPGDDRSPAWTWTAYVYTDGDRLVVPCEMVMRTLRSAGGQIIFKKTTTFKAMSQSGMYVPQEFCSFAYGDKGDKGPARSLSMAEIQGIRESADTDFGRHAHWARERGFTLFKKRAAVDRKKHVRVRPRFEQWSVSGRVVVVEDAITDDILQTMFTIAGRRFGLGDWRPGAPQSPGPYGMFNARLERVA